MWFLGAATCPEGRGSAVGQFMFPWVVSIGFQTSSTDQLCTTPPTLVYAPKKTQHFWDTPTSTQKSEKVGVCEKPRFAHTPAGHTPPKNSEIESLLQETALCDHSFGDRGNLANMICLSLPCGPSPSPEGYGSNFAQDFYNLLVASCGGRLSQFWDSRPQFFLLVARGRMP